MVIGRNDVFGKSPEPKKAPEPTPEQLQALDLLAQVDSGMTLTRFQIEAASVQEEDSSWMNVDNLIKTAVLTLAHVETTDPDDEKVTALAIALEAIALAVDMLDRDLEDVAKEALYDLR